MTDETDSNADRRTESATKIAVLEERSRQTQKQLDRIEANLSSHAAREEQVMNGILKAVEAYKNQTTEHVEKQIGPIRDDVTRVHGILWVLGILGTMFGGIIVIFRDSIARFFTGH